MAAERRGFGTRRWGFTLIEMLVVVGIVTLLVALILPVISIVRGEARLLQCSSNIRQLCIAFHSYANENRGKFPVLKVVPVNQQSYWYDQSRVPMYIGDNTLQKANKTGGSVFFCPADQEGTIRTYAMNYWACSWADPTNATYKVNYTPQAIDWFSGSNAIPGERLILVTETWAYQGGAATGFYSDPNIGFRGTSPAPGPRFGGGAGTPNPIARFGTVNSDLNYALHRKLTSQGTWNLPVGRLNIGYVDGHVAAKTNSELYDSTSGLSTLDSLWSPSDPASNY